VTEVETLAPRHGQAAEKARQLLKSQGIRIVTALREKRV